MYGYPEQFIPRRTERARRTAGRSRGCARDERRRSTTGQPSES